MRPPLMKLLQESDRSNGTLISPFADDFLKNLLRLVEQGRDLRSASDDPTINQQVLTIVVELNLLGLNSLEILQKTQTDKDNLVTQDTVFDKLTN